MQVTPLSASALLDAPPSRVYEVIADYREGHPAMLPPPFASLDVEEGGVGAGTKIRVGVRALGRTSSYRAVITEPEPGRVLVETNDTGYVTTFTVEPRDDGRRAHVTIVSVPPAKSGLAARVERWFVRKLMEPVFVKELERLEALARERAAR